MLKTTRFFFLAITAILWSFSAAAKTVRYELLIQNEKINLSGKKEVDFALTVNGSIPAPTLEFTEGDDAEILVRNGLAHEEVSIHWHGILLPTEQDGVPYTNTKPIHPGQSHLFKFKIRQNGTYWYHSHTGVQEQKGVYGAFVIHPRDKRETYDHDLVVVLSDWSDENAERILRNLKKDGDYYLFKKNSVRSYWGAIRARSLGPHLANEWSRMGGMDLSDVGYDAFLINGKRSSQLLNAKAGEKIRIRIINAAASTYFYVSMGLPMKVVAADGVDIKPIMANELLMGMAETYDIAFTVPERKNYELRATAQDVTGYASGWIGFIDGEKVFAPDKPAPNMYSTMEHGKHPPFDGPQSHDSHGSHGLHGTHGSHGAQGGHGADGGHHSHSGHDSHRAHAHHGHHPSSTQIIDTLTVDELSAIEPTTFPKQAKVHDLKLVLDGDMERYVWHINGKAIHQDRDLLVNEGDVVRFTFVNETMMHHPMHLHGHFFRVLNKNNEFSPLKHTVDVPPHGIRTIEFYANERGQWMLHCHNLYHMKTGMARVVKYMSYVPSSDLKKLEKKDPHLHDHVYTYGSVGLATHQVTGNFKVMRTWDEIELDIESTSDQKDDFGFGGAWHAEGDLFYRRWLGRFLNLMIGGTSYHEKEYGLAGLGYALPLLIETAVFVNHDGKFRIDLEKHFQWTSKIYSEVYYSWRPDWVGDESEYEVSLMYRPQWHWAIGASVKNDVAGIGALIRF